MERTFDLNSRVSRIKQRYRHTRRRDVVEFRALFGQPCELVEWFDVFLYTRSIAVVFGDVLMIVKTEH